MRYFILIVFLSSFSTVLLAQNWTTTNLPGLRASRLITPKAARYVKADADALRNLIFSAPHETGLAAEDSPVLISLPHPEDGTEPVFRIVTYDVVATNAPNHFPAIRAAYGINVDDPRQTVFLDWTARGFHASVAGGDRPGWYVDPVFSDNRSLYQTYLRDHAAKPTLDFDCQFKPDEGPTAPPVAQAGDCVLREYVIAITTTPEYSNYHGAAGVEDAGLVQSAVITTLNRVNQIYSRDISVRFQLAAGNDALYFYSAADSPFTDNKVVVLMNENPAVQDARLGAENYGLGHIFTQGANNGRALIRSACDEDFKSAGATSHVTPNGDPFAVDYVCHELGHQLGANHTQNNIVCNYSPISGMEPGSGSTIMGYAGICFPSVQDLSDAYFHGRSVEEITAFTENPFIGGRCATEVDNSLFNPQVANVSDMLLPAGTPFRLEGQATGPGGGTISYSWEQYNPEGAMMPPKADSDIGPLFRSLPPSAKGERYFPNLPAVIRGESPEWEVLPEVARPLDFRLTVRSTKAAYGCAGERDLNIIVEDELGNFTVTDPADGNQWSRGQSAQVQWTVAGTDGPGYRSPTVDILLSLDGGATFEPLVTGVPNDGFAEVTAPDTLNEQARIMVRSVGGMFYNVSPENFTIADTTGPAAISLTPVASTALADCFTRVNDVSFDFVTTSAGGANELLIVNVEGFPEAITATITPVEPRPGGRFTVTLSGAIDLPQGIHEATLSVTSAETGMTETERLVLVKLADEPEEGPAIVRPVNLAEDIRPTLSVVNNEAGRFQFQLSNQSDFSTLIHDETKTKPYFTLPDYLLPGARYFWRVRSIRGSGGCGISEWSRAEFFAGNCPIYRSTATPREITNGPPVQTVEMRLFIPDEGKITDVDLYHVDVEHSYLNDLEVELESPTGIIIPLLERSCASQDDLFLSFDDEGSYRELFCPPVDPKAFVRPPSTPLWLLDGRDIKGIWTLRARDNANQDGGSLNGFHLKTCLEPDRALPVNFLTFTATARKDDILLEWTTAAERDNEGFYVERATTFEQDRWTELGFVAADLPYQFTDATVRPATDYFYRLRQTDNDGRVTYSDIRTARLGGGGTALRLFPNPAGQRVSYRWALPDEDRNHRPYALTDASGRLLREGMLWSSGGRLDLSALPGGVYFVRVRELGVFRMVKL